MLRIQSGSLSTSPKLKYPITFKRQPKINFLARASNFEKRGNKRNSQYILNGIVFENEKCQILLCWGPKSRLKANFPVKNIPFFDLEAKNLEKIQNCLKYWHFWISVNQTFSKSEIFHKKLILTQWKCFKMVQKGFFFKILGLSRNFGSPAEQKSAFLIFKVIIFEKNGKFPQIFKTTNDLELL